MNAESYHQINIRHYLFFFMVFMVFMVFMIW